MIDRVTLRVSDFDESRRFDDAILAALGRATTSVSADPPFAEWRDFSITADGLPVSREAHVAFVAGSREQVDASHAAGVGAGCRGHGAPGERPHYHPGDESAYLLDPDGNNVEAGFHERG